ncbi:MAG: response regulator [Alicyclobacillus sp.]|nr:response regulator [Alicyclobacillus sp.]
MWIRTLLVDDSPETLDVLGMQYQAHPALQVVGCARDSEEARERLRRGDVDLVSIDIQLGADDGLALCEEVRRLHPEVFVVVCSVEGDEATSARARQAGAHHFLAKPCGYRDIQGLVNAYRSYRGDGTQDTEPFDIASWLGDICG